MVWSSLTNAPVLLSALAALGGAGWVRLLVRPNDRTSIIGSALYNHDLERYRRRAIKSGLLPPAAYEEAVRLANEKWDSAPRRKSRRGASQGRGAVVVRTGERRTR